MGAKLCKHCRTYCQRSSSPKCTSRLSNLIAERFYWQVILGDAIVCWRACVIWQQNHLVNAICGIFLLITLGELLYNSRIFMKALSAILREAGLGLIDTSQSCQWVRIMGTSYMTGGTTNTTAGSMFEGTPLGIATCALSLGTNTFATLLVAYKAWYAR